MTSGATGPIVAGVQPTLDALPHTSIEVFGKHEDAFADHSNIQHSRTDQSGDEDSVLLACGCKLRHSKVVRLQEVRCRGL